MEIYRMIWLRGTDYTELFNMPRTLMKIEHVTYYEAIKIKL